MESLDNTVAATADDKAVPTLGYLSVEGTSSPAPGTLTHTLDAGHPWYHKQLESAADVVPDTDVHYRWANAPLLPTKIQVNGDVCLTAPLRTAANVSNLQSLQQLEAAFDSLPPALSRPAGIAPAMDIVCGAMRTDPGYAWTWHCNVAMAMVDEGVDWVRANYGAARFLQTLAKVDTSQFVEFGPVRHRANQPLAQDSCVRLTADSWLVTNGEQCKDAARRWYSHANRNRELAPFNAEQFEVFAHPDQPEQLIVTFSLSEDELPRQLASYTSLRHLKNGL